MSAAAHVADRGDGRQAFQQQGNQRSGGIGLQKGGGERGHLAGAVIHGTLRRWDYRSCRLGRGCGNQDRTKKALPSGHALVQFSLTPLKVWLKRSTFHPVSANSLLHQAAVRAVMWVMSLS